MKPPKQRKIKEEIRELWLDIQWWVGERLMDLSLIKQIKWTNEHPWILFYD